VTLDGTTIKKLLEGSDWRQRCVRAPFRPAEGVRVEPYEEGRWFISRADVDREYPANPATPAAATDQQRPVADGPNPSQSPPAQRQPQQPTNKREPTSGDVRASKRRRTSESGSGSGAQTLRARAVLKRLYGGPAKYPTEEEVSTPDLLGRFGAEYDRVEGRANPPSKLNRPSRAVVLREVGRQED